MKNILIFIGGKSPEHEVSVITGLQVLENIDRKKYIPFLIYISKDGVFWNIENAKNRKDFLSKNREEVSFGFCQKELKPFFKNIYSSEKISIDCAINCLHGGVGECGGMAGFFESLNIPFSSTSVESSVLSMNKDLSKKISKVNVVDSETFLSSDLKNDFVGSLNKCKNLGLPVIIKPVHLGSSIGIKVAKNEIELELFLKEVLFLDDQIMVEKFLENIVEYNCSAKKINGLIYVSEVENPISSSGILSFSEKYQKGGKKSASGMASLVRNLPAKIPKELRVEIQDMTKNIYKNLKCKGVVRIDFIYSNDKLYFNEINPIPGSLSYYLWETEGISFKDQISENIEQSIKDFDLNSSNFIYKTDIIKKFIENFKD